MLNKYLLLFFVVTTITYPTLCLSKPSASMKFSTNRVENPSKAKELIVLPYAFPSESMGTTGGVGGMAKGYGQKQLLIAGAGWGSVDDAAGGILGVWDFRVPYSDRLYISAVGSLGTYPRQRAYTSLNRGANKTNPGSNSSDPDDFVQEEGLDNWFDIKLEYVLPIGTMKNSGVAKYEIKGGVLQSSPTGGPSWNPLKYGATIFVLKQYNRYESYENDIGLV